MTSRPRVTAPWRMRHFHLLGGRVSSVQSWRLPAIAPRNLNLFAGLHIAHVTLAVLLFVAFTAHMCAVLFHTLVLRDRLLSRMSLWPSRSR